MTQPDIASWEAFLDSVEADMHRTETLLLLVVSDAGSFPAGAEDLVRSVTAPPVLPDPAEMPTIPDDLLVRVRKLRERITLLRKELELALRTEETRMATVTSLHRPGRTHRTVDSVAFAPRYVDTAL